MSHMIDMSNNRANMAYIGETPWHGLGFELPAGENDLEVWRKVAGLDWDVKRSPVRFDVEREIGEPRIDATFNERDVLYRSDNRKPLSVVSSGYKVHNVNEIIEFYRELLKDSDFQMETMGSLDEGRRIWALAKHSQDIRIAGQDLINPYVLLATAFDGTMATLASFTTVRVVCQNTLSMSVAQSEREDSGSKVRVCHNQTFSPKSVARELLDMESRIGDFADTAGHLAETGISDVAALELFMRVFGKVDEDDNVIATKPLEKAVLEMMTLFKNGPGSDLRSSRGTAWGAVNAVTRYVDHSAPARSDNNRLSSAWFGAGSKKKTQAVEQALALAA